MRVALLSLLLTVFCMNARAQCDISTSGVTTVNATNTANVSSICIGDQANFKFTIINFGTDPSCVLPINSVRAVFSFPNGAIKPYVYNGPNVFTTTFFTWTYNPGTRVLVGMNTTAIPEYIADNVLIPVIGNAAGTATSPLTLTQLLGISDNTNNNTGSAQLIVNALPTVSDQSDQVHCNTSTFTMTQTTPGVGTGVWSLISGPATINTPASPTTNITLAAGNTATVRWTVTSGTCSAFDEVVLTNYEQPVVSDQLNQAQCNNGSFTMTQTTPSVGTGVWTLMSGTVTITTPGSPTTTLTDLVAGTSATVRWTVTNGTCSAFDEVTVTNDIQPVVSNQPNQAKCDNGSFTMTQTTPSVGTGVWTLVSGTVAITTPGSPTTTLTGLLAGESATVRWTVTNGTCSAFDEVTVTNDILPVISDQPNQANCNSGSFTVTQSELFPGTGVWTLESGTASITTPASATTTVTGVPVGTSATVRWTITNGTCMVYDDITLTNSAVPTANAGADITSCVSGPPVFTVTGAIGGAATTATWSTDGGGSFSSTVWDGLGQTYTPAGSDLAGPFPKLINITLTTNANGACPAAVDNLQITLNQVPALATTPAAYCFGGSVDISTHVTDNNSTTGTQTYYATLSDAQLEVNAISPVVSAAGTYYIRKNTNNTPSCDDIVSIVVTENPLPTVSFSGLAASYCQNALVVTLTGNQTPGGTFTGAGITDNNDGTASFNPATAGLGTHNITYSYTNINGCSNSYVQSVTVDELPVVSDQPNQALCNVSTYSMTQSAPSAGTGAWTLVGGSATITTASDPTTTITNVVAGTSATVRWTVTNGACTVFDEVTLTNNALPVVTWTNTLTNQCFSSTTYTLTGGTSLGAGTYSGAGVTGTDFNASVAGVGVHTLTYTYTDGNGCTNSATNTIEVYALPTVSWTNTLVNQCFSSTTYTLTGGTSTGAGTYSGAGVTGTNFDASIAGVGVHTLTYTYTDGNGCTNSATNTIEVYALPTVTWTNTLTNQCFSSTTYTLTEGTSAGAGTYSGAGVTGTNFDASVAGVGVHTLTYTYTDGNGCTNSATNTIEVYALPTVTWTNTLVNQCFSSTIYTLAGGTAAGPGTYSGAGVTGTNFDASVAGVGVHTLTYTYTDGNGCTNSATNTIEVYALPTVTWTNTLVNQCFSSTTYTLTGGTSLGAGTYSGAGVTGTNFDASVAGVGVHTLTYTYTDGNGCTNSATNSIEVYALPTVTWTNTLVNQCFSSTTYTLTGGTAAGAGTYSGAGVTGTNFNANVAGVGVHTLTYTYTDGNGCTNSATNTIEVYALPTVTWTNTLVNQCFSSTTYTLTGGTSAGAGTYSGAGVTGTNFDASVAGVGVHTLTYTYTDGNGCTNSATNSIEVYALPVVSWTNTLTNQCFSSTTYTLTGGTSAGAGTYSGAGVTGTNFDASVAGVGVHTLTYTYTDGNGCTNSATNTIDVYALPVVTWTNTLVNQCFSSTTYTLTGGTAAGAGTYSGAGVTGTNFNASVAGVGVHTITYTYTDGNGCTNSATNTIEVYALPTVTWTNTLTNQCFSSTTYTLTGGTSVGAGTYSGAGVTGTNFNANVAGVGVHTLTYTYTDGNGCTNSATNSIEVYALPVVTWTNTLTNQCFSSTTYTLTGGTSLGAGTYSGAGVTGTNFDASVAGVGVHTLTYTYTDGNGCTNSATNSIEVYALPVVTWTNTLVNQCFSSTTYTLTGGTSAGAGTYSGAGVTGTNFNASVAGVGVHTLTYTYTDGNGCTNSATNTIEVYALPTVSWTNTLVNQCFSSTTYTLTGGTSLGAGTYSGAGVTGTNFDASVAGVGVHTLTYTYTDGNGCTNSATNTIEVYALPTVSWTNTLTNQCFSSTTYTLTGGTSLGAGTYSGAGVTGTNFDASVAGVGVHTLTYTYTDGNGCTNSATNSIEVYALPTVTWTNTLTNQCFSSTTYTLTGGTSAGAGTYSGAGVTGTNFDASVAGVGVHILTYTYTDGNGCSNSATNTIEVYALPTVSWTNTLTNQCFSSTTYTLTGGTAAGAGTYSGAGVTGTNFDASVAGVGVHTLTYTYTDGNGCTNSATNTIEVYALPTVSWTNTLTNQCFSSTTYTLTGGTSAGAGTYSGAGVTGTNFDASVAGVGVHTLTYTYTDGNGCTNSATNSIEVYALPTVSWTNTLVNQCFSSTTYTLTGGTSTGAGTYSGAGVTGTNFDASIAGVGVHTLTYTYTDGNGCTNSATNTIEVYALPTVTWTNTLTNQCFSSTTYTLTGGTSLGAGTYSGAGVTGTNFNASVAGVGVHTLTYTYTDGNGCTNSATNTIEVYALPTATISYGGSPYCATGTATVTQGGQGAGTYSSTPGLMINASTGAIDLVASTVGTYIVTYSFTDGTCNNSTTANVTINALPVAGITNNTGSTELTCSLTTISVTATGGVSYAWDGGATPATADNSFTAPGTYTVIVTGANGCTSSASITVTQNITAPIALITNNTGTTELTCTILSINVTASGGVSYTWDGGTSINSANNSFLNPNTYTVTVTGANGCIGNAHITITQNTTPPAAGITNNTGTTVLTCATTSISVTATGGASYSWDGGATPGTATNSFTTAGTYQVTVTGANGCVSFQSIAITQNITAPTAGITNNTGTTILNCSTPSISVTATGGVSYAWDGGATPTTADNSFTAPGTYAVLVTGSNGCTNSTSITITLDGTLPTASISYAGSPYCATGTATVTQGGQGGGTYSSTSGLVIDGSTGDINLAGSTAGTYTVTYSFTNGTCSNTTTTTITINPVPPAPSITVVHNANGTYTLTASVLPGATVLWSTTETVNPITVATSGTYTVTQTSLGCTSPAGSAVIQPACDPAVGNMDITDLSDVTLPLPGGANTTPYNQQLKLKIPVYNLNSVNILPAGSTTLRIDLGTKFIVDPTFTLATAPMDAYFHWTEANESGHVVIYGNQYTDIPVDFIGLAVFQVVGTTSCTSAIAASITLDHHASTTFVTDEDVNNNTTSLSYTVVVPPLTLSVTQPTCAVGGIIMISAPTATGMTYSINGVNYANTSGTFSGLTAGSYPVTAKTADGCISPVNTVTIDPQPAGPSIVPGTIVDNTCHGSSNGSITVTSDAISPTYSIAGPTVNNSGETSGVFTNLLAGSYTVTVLAANGCSSSVVVSVGEPAGTAPDISLGADYSSNFFTGPGAEDTIVYNISEVAGNAATGDTLRIIKIAGYTFSFDPAATAITINSGTYTLDNSRWKFDISNPSFISLILDPAHNSVPGTLNCSERLYVSVRLKRNTTNLSTFALSVRLRKANAEVNLSNNLNSIVFTAE